jgi:hypothetical protein
VNANFSAVKTAVDDNDTRITTLQSKLNLGVSSTFAGTGAGNLTVTGSDNTGLGANALFGDTSGAFNTATGSGALQHNTTGNSNTASGANALQSNLAGNGNTATGVNALMTNGGGGVNTAMGLNAMMGNTTGSSNTASGFGALSSNTTGSDNVAVGQSALGNNTTGGDNIAIGNGAGLNQTTGNFNIYIGAAGVAAESNTLRINTTTGLAATFIAGISGATVVAGGTVLVDANGHLGTNPSSRRFKDDIADMGEASSALMKLRPVTFHYKIDKNPKGRTLQYGLVAEEVATVAPGLVAHSADGKIESVYYQFLAPMLLNEYQKQQRTITAQTARIAQLEKQSAEIAELKQQLTRMAGLLGRLEEARVASAGR